MYIKIEDLMYDACLDSPFRFNKEQEALILVYLSTNSV